MKIERVAASKGCMTTTAPPEYQHAVAEATRLTAERDTARTERDRWRQQAERLATFQANLAETVQLDGSEGINDRIATLAHKETLIPGLKQQLAAAEAKTTNLRLALDGLHDQLITATQRSQEASAAREREVKLFGEEVARLPWEGWCPPAPYPFEMFRAVVDKVIADAKRAAVEIDDIKQACDYHIARAEKAESKPDGAAAQCIRAAIMGALGIAETERATIDLVAELVQARDQARHDADRARMNLDDAKKWDVRALTGYRALAHAVDPEMKWPHDLHVLPTSEESKALCDRATKAREEAAIMASIRGQVNKPAAPPVSG